MYRYLIIVGDNIYRLRVFQHAKMFSKALRERNIKIKYEIEDSLYPMFQLLDYDTEPAWFKAYSYTVFRELIEAVDHLPTRELDPIAKQYRGIDPTYWLH